jgi:hypothetical protein
MNRVISPEPIEKSCQLIMTRFPFWLIVVTPVPLPLIVPFRLPPTTVPPVGLAKQGSPGGLKVSVAITNHDTTLFIWRSKSGLCPKGAQTYQQIVISLLLLFDRRYRVKDLSSRTMAHSHPYLPADCRRAKLDALQHHALGARMHTTISFPL